MRFAFYTEIQDGRQKWWENVFGKSRQLTLLIQRGSKILTKSLSHTVSKIKCGFAFYKEIQDGHQKWWKNDFWESRQLTIGLCWW